MIYHPDNIRQLNKVCALLNDAKSILEDLGFESKALEIDAIELSIDTEFLEDA